jgi:mRNA interferase RelE/StbE
VNYTIEVSRSAERSFEKLPKEIYLRVREKLVLLKQKPRPPGVVKLRGEPAWRIRVGTYRIVYEIDDERKHIIITAVGHRREIYR